MTSPARIIGIDASRAARAHRTGTETYALALINTLPNLIPESYQLRLYTPHPPQHPEWPKSSQVETRVIPWPRLWTHLRLATELHQHPPDVLFVPSHVLPLYCPVPAVVTVHDLGYYHHPEAHRNFDRWYLSWTTQRHTRVAAHILADSLATKQDLVEVYKSTPDQISVVYLGRDETLKRTEDLHIIDQTKSKYGIEGDYVLYLGTLQPRKNLVRLIEAFQQALTTTGQPDLKLVIAGKKGWLYNDIFQQVTKLGLVNRVVFPGYVDDSDKSALLSGALLYAFPSLYEGFGLPVLEAMACGVPVLTSNISSLPEVAGEATLLVNPYDTAEISEALVQLIQSSDLRQRLVRQGFQQIENFSWQSAAKQVLDVLENVMAE